jgi:hypothetical protein
MLLDRYFKLIKTDRRDGRLPIRRPLALYDGTPPLPPSPERRQREILIGMLLEHPFLIAEAYEEIAELDFAEPELDSLLRAILEIEVLSPGLDAEALRQHLGQNGFAKTVDATVTALTGHAGYLLSTLDADAVRRSWSNLVRMLSDGDLSEPSERGLGEQISEDPTGAAWQRQFGWEVQEEQAEEDFLPSRLRGTGEPVVRNARRST